MKTSTMWFSLSQLPRCRAMWGSFYKFGSTSGCRVLCSNHHEPTTKWTRRTINTEGAGTNETNIESRSCKLKATKRSRKVDIGNEIVSESVSAKFCTHKSESERVESDEHCVELAKLATIICFDIETTGFGREKDRIIEFACQDLRGGENSTFQSLVNPERDVPNERIHGISTRMVNRHDVPRMKEFIPILVQYVRSRQLPGGVVLLVSHNARAFDVPFLKNEFNRCSHHLPHDWYFADTLPLSRSAMKLKGSKVPLKISLQALREHYGIPIIGPAHRALSDVHSLSLILQRLTYDLKLPISGLIQGSFR